MSEYQYHEFLAVDHPLTPAQQAEVGALAGGAEVTSSGFTDEFDDGDFPGDPLRMMELYFDAHLCVTGWGTRRVMLRLPQEVLPLGAVRPFRLEEQVEAFVAGRHLILDLCNDDDEGDWDEGGDEDLAVIAGVRAELASGDLRPLYLAWLAAIGTWDRDEDAFEDDFEDELEPPVPAGLGSPSASQRALADFLRLDPDLLATAAHETGDEGAPRRTVAELLDTMAETRQKREQGVMVNRAG
ncbi:hypothetical protein GCM10022226_38130 [Sphaerisporangium flaviroseum]|uniref:Uncharacterized protein n=1 Tax=Sphaerisporangium flaviroseum TaxID=509199 RepID=A0ABP7IAP5_9ACTN